ncbi:MAG TPA: TonB-dependent receptor [Blastocatellia bacterium]|nr:TonB-dependent receptor [Blastocatellia bacterium]
MKNSLQAMITFAVSCILCFGVGLTQVWAQSPGSLSGRTTDSQGAAVAGATVTLYTRPMNVRTTTVTDASGRYSFDRLPEGDYVVEATSNGFGSFSRTFRVERGAPGTLDFALEIAGLNETVLVTAAGTPQTVDEVSKAVSVVTSEEIDRRGEYSLGEALRTVPGLRVQQLGGPGTFTRIQTRGLRDSDTAILVDGLRLRDAASTQGDATSFIEELFTVSSDRLEVVRGSGSSLYGTNAIGGVVNVISDQGGAPAHGQVQLEGGQLGLFRGRAQLAGGLDQNRFVYSGGLSLLNVSDGVNKTPTRNFSGQGFARYNFTPNISLATRLFGNTAYLALTDSPFTVTSQTDIARFLPGFVPPPTGSVVDAVALSIEQQQRIENGLTVTDRGAANYVPNLRDPDSRRDSNYLTVAVIFNQRINDAFGYRASYQRVNTNRQFSDGTAGVRFEPAFNSSSNFDGRIDTFNIQADAKVGQYSLLTVGYEFERERYIGRNRDENPNPALRTNAGTEVEQRSNAFFIQNQWRALENRFQVATAFRLQSFDLRQPEFFGGTSVYSGQRYESPKTAYTGDGSISYFFSSTGTKLRAHVGNGYRAPAPFERFGSSIFNGVFSGFGDPRLRPERSIAVDAGIDQRLAKDRVQLSATYFYTRLQEVIVFDSSGFITPATDPFGRFGGYRNTGGGLARGVELAANTKPYRTLDLSASYTFTNAVNRVPSSVPGFLRTFVQPRHAFTLFAAQQITRRLDVIFDMFAYGSYFFPFSSRAFKFSGPVKADLGMSYSVPMSDRVSMRFYGKVENIFDREYFESGFRTPGAGFTGGMGLRF